MRKIAIQTRPKFTPTRGTRHGYSIELDPDSQIFHVMFIEQMVKIANKRGFPIRLLDFGSGNGDRSVGLIKFMQKAGFKGKVLYHCYDLDFNSVREASKKVLELENTKIICAEQVNLKNHHEKSKLPKVKQNQDILTIVLMTELLHWFSPEDINDYLSFLYEYVPAGSKVLVTACSVWNRTSIGNAQCTQQSSHIEFVEKYLTNHTDTLLYREPDEIEFKAPMTHFTKESLTKVMKQAGFSVNQCHYYRNVIFPNNTKNLPEQLFLTATKPW